MAQGQVDNQFSLELLWGLVLWATSSGDGGRAGGTHHSAFSYDITAEYWEDFCEILGIEFVNIDKNTTISSFKQQLRNNEIYYMLNKALR